MEGEEVSLCQSGQVIPTVMWMPAFNQQLQIHIKESIVQSHCWRCEFLSDPTVRTRSGSRKLSSTPRACRNTSTTLFWTC